MQISLKVNFIWAFLGNAVSAFCMWMLLVLLAKMDSPETVGVFGVAQAVGLPISMLFSLKLQLAQVTDAKNEYDFGHYYAVKIITAALTVLSIAIAGFVFYNTPTACIITILGLGYSLVAFREVFLAVLQKSERMDLMAGSRILEGIFCLVLFGLIFYLTKSLPFSLFGLIAARVIVLLLYDMPFSVKLLRENGYKGPVLPSWKLRKLCRLVITTVPLGLVAWLCTLFTSIPRLILDKYSGREDVGYFVAMSSLLVANTMIVAALSQAVSPRLSRYYVDNIKAFKILLFKLLLIGAVLGIAGILIVIFFGKYILTILFTSAYAAYDNVFVLLMSAGLFLVFFSFMNVGLTAARKFLIQVPLYAVSAIVCFVCSFVLIPELGMVGAAYSLIICYAVGFIGCTYYVRKVILTHENCSGVCYK